ncbi:MAG: ComF family protein [Desulfobacterota bacterium]|nr:ComF family protein [Thermodesulfobacteriota bacterium]
MKKQLQKNLMIGGIANFISPIVDFIFPPKCLICDSKELHQEDSFICEACFSKIPFISPPFCERCGKPFFTESIRNYLCGECMGKELFFNQVQAIGKYEGVLKIIIHNFKYHLNFSMIKLFNMLLENLLHSRKIFLNFYDLIIPVPLHQSRLRERGFNQAVILGKILSRRYRIPLKFTTLERIKPTSPQVRLPVKTRRLNVRNAFRVKNPAVVEGKRILIVDDVYTTGATINECAQILKKSGASIVDGLVIARAI